MTTPARTSSVTALLRQPGKSLRRQLLQSFSVFSVILFILLGYAAYRIALHETQEILDKQMQEMAYFLAETSIEHLDSTFKSEHRYDETDVFIDVWTYQPDPLYAIKPHEDNEHIRLPRVDKAFFREFQSSIGELKVFVLPTANKQIQISQLMSVRQHLAEELALNMLVPYVVLMPLVLLGISWLIRRSLRPLLHLQQLIATRSPTDLTPVHVENLPLEVMPTIDELNHLFAEIEQAKRQQQQFVADAAHELRSPITALNLQLKVLQKTVDYPLAQDRHFINLQQGLQRTQHLVTQMMALAHQDADQKPYYEWLDLAEQTTLILEQLIYSARRKNIDLGLKNHPDTGALMVYSSRDYLYSIMFNLIDNAIKYTPPHGAVDISFSQHDDVVRWSVEDSGAGVAPEHYEQLVKRFVRLPNMHQAQVGSGLGLSIVHTAVQHLGGELQFSSAQLGGLAVTVTLPLH